MSSRRRDISNELYYERTVTLLFFAFIASLIVTIIVLDLILRIGQLTAFPPDAAHIGWVANPDNRGTSNIIFSCLSAIFTCVYVSVHVDVADPTEYDWLLAEVSERFSGSGGTMLSCAVRLFVTPGMRKVYWILFNIFAPEFMIFVAIMEYYSASSGVVFMQSKEQKGWTMRHAYFADMGGFKTEGGTVLRTGRQVYAWYERSQPSAKLDYARIGEEIRDRSKANVVLKVYTCVQASWLLVETVVRFARQQPVSELEVTACSYIMCAIATYAYWLRKPYGVEGHITLHTLPPGEECTTSDSTGCDSSSESAIRTLLQSFTRYRRIKDEAKPSGRVSLPQEFAQGVERITPFNRAYINEVKACLVASLAAAFAGAAIGVIHAVPFWNSHFPITEGKWIWRVCCGIQAVLPLVFEAAQVILALKGIARRVWLATTVILVFIYGLSRCALFALIFLSFKNQPIGVYRDVDWSWAVIPHWH